MLSVANQTDKRTPILHSSDELDQTSGDLRFRSLLDVEDWERLPKATRRRFSKRVKGGDTVVYTGNITKAEMNTYGRFLANILRLVGAPLPISDEVNVPTIVTVTEDVATGGQMWTRLYTNNTTFPQIIQSAKRFTGSTGLEEYIGFGISMALNVGVTGQSLVFRNADYFLNMGSFRLRLPRIFHPADLTVVHTDKGNDEFEFELILQHRLFGKVLHQAGLYRDEKIQ